MGSTRVLLAIEQLRRPVPGGIGTYTCGLLQGLVQLKKSRQDAKHDREDLDVTLLASRIRSTVTSSKQIRDPLSALPFPLITNPLPSKVMTWLWASGVAGVAPGFDVVHSVSLAAPPCRFAPEVVTVHDLAWRELPDAFPWTGRRWHELALKRVLKDAHLFVVPSSRTASELMTAGVPAQRIEIIEEGCDHLPPPDLSAVDHLLSTFQVKSPFILSVSTLEPRKNLGTLLEAYAGARERVPGIWPLVVVGPRGWKSSDIGARGYAGVSFVGQVPAQVLSGLYHRAGMFVYIPLFEGFGLPPVEAMHAGVPVLASPIPSTNGAALEVDPTDPTVVEESLIKMFLSEEMRNDLIAQGRERVANLTWVRAALRHVELWESIK